MPQLVGLVWVLVSQPLNALLPSQSAKPDAHAPLQTPALHDGAGMWFVEHTRPHTPQFETLLVTFVSHPFVRLLPSQSLKPPAHTPVQFPPLQAGVMLFSEHGAPHAPQFEVLDVTSVSQPFVSLFKSQSPHPEAHAPVQTLAAHAVVGT